MQFCDFKILYFLGALAEHKMHYYQYITIFVFIFFYVRCTKLNLGKYILIHTKDALSFSYKMKNTLGVPYDTKNMLR